MNKLKYDRDPNNFERKENEKGNNNLCHQQQQLLIF